MIKIRLREHKTRKSRPFKIKAHEQHKFTSTWLDLISINNQTPHETLWSNCLHAVYAHFSLSS